MAVIKLANEIEYEQARRLWMESFGDSEELIDQLYQSLEASCYVLLDEGELRSSLCLYEAGRLNGQGVFVSYAVCTDKDCRGKGYASELCSYVKNSVLEAGGISLVSPAEPSLQRFYESLGYAGLCTAKQVELDPEALDLSEIDD